MNEVLRADHRGWDIRHLHSHLQGVVDLELWTIPYYMSAMYSIKDPSSEAYRLILAVVHQEMLHVQLAANIANAFGYSPRFVAPVYEGHTIPHINFCLDVPNPTHLYHPYSAEIGPLDEIRLNTMCLIEYPEWDTERSPDLRESHQEYGSIGEFYDAVRAGITQLRRHIRGGRNQVDEFRYYYNNFPEQTITRDGDDGYRQAMRLIDIITDQGEGSTEDDAIVDPVHWNTADGYQESWPHYHKFRFIRALSERPAVYNGLVAPPPDSPGFQAQQNLVRDFGEFLQVLQVLFGGGDPGEFGPLMATIGADILTCWQRNATPRFS